MQRDITKPNGERSIARAYHNLVLLVLLSLFFGQFLLLFRLLLPLALLFNSSQLLVFLDLLPLLIAKKKVRQVKELLTKMQE